MEAVTTIDAMPASLKERVLTHMKYKCGGGVLKGGGAGCFAFELQPAAAPTHYESI